MLTERITLPNGTIIEFFASTPEQMKLMLPSYRYAEEKITQQRQAKTKKNAQRRQKQARRKNRGK
ncbi:hypothetical protein MB831_06530 [Pasteurella multocida subsp. multocida]|uniref:Uncharacterized protein n=1 Tax=Pasteurella multocida TaxID=747 RepID=A0A849CPI8_PASMD|nr:hypothetical protein [Pasteurella multocida]AFI45440.1 hypothetical protein NT08PM_0287 [Pasteurella multocida subsp. multocida str. 3480]AWW54638.1 hypothetical protein DID83_09155 [Pasteurella multocida]EPE72446.1 hypothetical protein H364_02888 [Pasteurella multocida 671/90]MBF6980753.1 hypothetical protein [Pasteurella multocida]MBF6985504.1 hypothetical protein [Pasteurella multocida]